jgi:hypothetical protein
MRNAGQYSARGYMVGDVTVSSVPPAPASAGGSNAAGVAAAPEGAIPRTTSSAGTLEAALPALKFPGGKPFVAQEKIHVGLVANPLERERPGSADLAVGFDAKGSWLQLADGLPLKAISTTPGLKWAAVGRSAPGEPLVVFQGDGVTVEEFVITKIAEMMAFDCGGFDLPEAGPGAR